MNAVPPSPPPSGPDSGDSQGTSTRPYLIRALHEWCTDNDFTPYLAVHVDTGVLVPMEYVKNREIVLNVGYEATSGLVIGNERIEFKARFGGVAREISVPVDHVIAIYARENGQGMAFPLPTAASGSEPLPGGAAARAPSSGPALRLAHTGGESQPAASAPHAVAGDARETPRSDPPVAPVGEAAAGDEEPDPRPPSGGPRPALKRVK